MTVLLTNANLNKYLLVKLKSKRRQYMLFPLLILFHKHKLDTVSKENPVPTTHNSRQAVLSRLTCGEGLNLGEGQDLAYGKFH